MSGSENLREVRQLSRDDLKRLDSEQIEAAREAGMLNAILGREVPVEVVSDDDDAAALNALTLDAIEAVFADPSGD